MLALYLLAVGLILATTVFLLFFYRNWRRERIVRRPFPDAWRAILVRHVRVYRHLPPALRDRLEQLIQIFLDEKHFYGCAGLTIDDRIRVTIAAEACLLILNLPLDYYAGLQSILVYPGAFRVRSQTMDAGIWSEQDNIHLGEAWSQGKIILSWEDAASGAQSGAGGHNVVIHEFTHQLDQADGSADGAPPLGARGDLRAWSQAFSSAFDELRHQLIHDRHPVIDAYGATNPAEFFAVTTELFFERPHELQSHYPALYRQLEAFFRLDPATWYPR